MLNKPPGLATQGGSKTTKHVDGLLDAFVEDEKTPRPRLVHRLDKDTSGVLLIARTPGSAASFSKRFASRSARKVYWALVVGKPQLSEGVIDAALAKQPGTGGEKMHIDEENGATRYIPGSHHWTTLDDVPSELHSLTQPFRAPAGSILIMDGRVWHTSGANVSANRDRALLFAYYSAEFLRPQVNHNATLSAATQAEAALDPELFAWLGLGPDANVRVEQALIDRGLDEAAVGGSWADGLQPQQR